MAAVAVVALGVAVGVGMLFFATSSGVELSMPPQTPVAKMNANYYYEKYSSLVSSRDFVNNGFQRNARVIRQIRGENEIPAYEVELNGRRTQIYRMPSEL